MGSSVGIGRVKLLRRGELLEAATVVWNVIEGMIAVAAGVAASSVALIGFGVDSFVETASGAIVGWRLHAELSGHADEERAEILERRTGRIAGALLLVLPSTSSLTPGGDCSASGQKLVRAPSGSC